MRSSSHDQIIAALLILLFPCIFSCGEQSNGTNTDGDQESILDGDAETESDEESSPLPSSWDCDSPLEDAVGNIFQSEGDPYQPGPLNVTVLDVAEGEHGAPKALQLYVPDTAATLPVIVFQHGFTGDIHDLNELLTHLASHGFVVAAPQMYPPGDFYNSPKTPEEAEDAKALYPWLACNLRELTSAKTDPNRFGLAGHSRAGKMLGLVLEDSDSFADAVAYIDPVDGTFDFGGMEGEELLIDGPFNYTVPALILGTGKGPPCAPEGDNHIQFFQASPAPAWHVVATDYGHNDMLDADVPVGFCPGGEPREAMLRLTGGVMAAFFRATLQGREEDKQWLTNTEAAPVAVTMESRTE